MTWSSRTRCRCDRTAACGLCTHASPPRAAATTTTTAIVRGTQVTPFLEVLVAMAAMAGRYGLPWGLIPSESVSSATSTAWTASTTTHDPRAWCAALLVRGGRADIGVSAV